MPVIRFYIEHSLAELPAEYIQHAIDTTVLAMTEQEELHPQWHEQVSLMLDYALQKGEEWQAEIDFFTAVRAILNSETPALPEQHVYAQALADMQKGIEER